jgi:hypothetical protein
MFIWICAQWEEYHTSNMVYGNEYFGVMECNYSLAAVHIVTAIIGPEVYQEQLAHYLPFAKHIPVIKHWSEWMLAVGLATAQWC